MASNAPGRGQFTMIPAIVYTLGLKPREFRLYACYIHTCGGNGGTCFKSVDTLAAECGMGAASVVRARKALAVGHPELGGKALVSEMRKRTGRGGRESVVVQLTDLWSENSKLPDGPTSNMEVATTTMEVPNGLVGQDVTTPPSNVEVENEPPTSNSSSTMEPIQMSYSDKKDKKDPPIPPKPAVKAPAKKAKARKPTVIGLWYEAHEKADADFDKPILTGKEKGHAKEIGKLVKDETLTWEQVADYMLRYLNDTSDAFIVNAGFPLSLFTGRIDRYRKGDKVGPVAPAAGASDSDYKSDPEWTRAKIDEHWSKPENLATINDARKKAGLTVMIAKYTEDGPVDADGNVVTE